MSVPARKQEPNAMRERFAEINTMAAAYQYHVILAVIPQIQDKFAMTIILADAQPERRIPQSIRVSIIPARNKTFAEQAPAIEKATL
jgi:hypothetical protein